MSETSCSHQTANQANEKERRLIGIMVFQFGQ